MIGYLILAGAVLVGSILISEAIRASSRSHLLSSQEITEEIKKLRQDLANQIWNAANPDKKSPSSDGWWSKTFDREEKL
jgi:hypothetical protein